MKLNINNTNLKISAGFANQFPNDPIPQIAFSGRSNVGKSSLINSLLNRKSFARVSSAPGKTITINFYDVDKKLYLVDLPGYGYAKRTYEEQVKWSSLTDGYFTDNKSINSVKLVCQLIDSKVGMTEDDVSMINYLIQAHLKFVIVATKIDRLNKTELNKTINEINSIDFPNNYLGLIPYSSKDGIGKNELWKKILEVTNL